MNNDPVTTLSLEYYHKSKYINLSIFDNWRSRIKSIQLMIFKFSWTTPFKANSSSIGNGGFPSLALNDAGTLLITFYDGADDPVNLTQIKFKTITIPACTLDKLVCNIEINDVQFQTESIANPIMAPRFETI